jgi:hypothetical protein
MKYFIRLISYPEGPERNALRLDHLANVEDNRSTDSGGPKRMKKPQSGIRLSVAGYVVLRGEASLR